MSRPSNEGFFPLSEIRLCPCLLRKRRRPHLIFGLKIFQRANNFPTTMKIIAFILVCTLGTADARCNGERCAAGTCHTVLMWFMSRALFSGERYPSIKRELIFSFPFLHFQGCTTGHCAHSCTGHYCGHRCLKAQCALGCKGDHCAEWFVLCFLSRITHPFQHSTISSDAPMGTCGLGPMCVGTLHTTTFHCCGQTGETCALL